MAVVQLLVTEDEAEVVAVSGEALLQVASRLNGADLAFRPAADGNNTATTFTGSSATTAKRDDSRPPLTFVTLEDAAGFVCLLREVLEHYAAISTAARATVAGKGDAAALRGREPQPWWQQQQQGEETHDGANVMVRQRLAALRHLVFEVQPEILATLLSILNAPHMMSEGDALCHLFCSVLTLLQTVVLSCCILSEQSAVAQRGPPLPLESVELSATTTELLDRLGAVHIVADLLHDEYPISVRQTAVQLLFAMLLRDGSNIAQGTNSYVRDALTTPECLSTLLAVLTTTTTTTTTTITNIRAEGAGTESHISVGTDGLQPSGSSMTNSYITPTPVQRERPLLLLRLHAAVCLRELANTHYSRLGQSDVLSVLHCLSGTEPEGDLRALSIESLDIVLRQKTSLQWADAVPFKRELAALCVTQLERESHHDALRATLCLIETLIRKDATYAEYPTDGGMHCVCETLLALFADRALAALVGDAAFPLSGGGSSERSNKRTPLFRAQQGDHQRHGVGVRKQQQQRWWRRSCGEISVTSAAVVVTPVACLAARCLRLLVQHAPFYRNGGFYLVQHLPSLEHLLEVSVRLAGRQASHPNETSWGRDCSAVSGQSMNKSTDANARNETDEAALMLAVELVILVGLCLAQDPRARQLLASEFCEHHVEAQQVRSALLSNLNLVSLSYFSDGHENCADAFRIVDVTGVHLNAIDAITWDTPDRPARAAVREVFTTQEQRWNAGGSPLLMTLNRRSKSKNNGGIGNIDDVGSASYEDGRNFASIASLDQQRHERLTFILLSYSIHYTFKLACDDPIAALNFTAALHGTVMMGGEGEKVREDGGRSETSHVGRTAEPATKGMETATGQKQRTRAASRRRASVTANTSSTKTGTVVGVVPAPVFRPKTQGGQRYYDTFLDDANKTFNGGNEQQRKQLTQVTKEMESSLLLSPAPRDPRSRRGPLVSPSMHPDVRSKQNVADGADDNTGAASDMDTHLLVKFSRSFLLFRHLAMHLVERPASALGSTIVYQATEEKGMVRRQGWRQARETVSKLLQEDSEMSSCCLPSPRVQKERQQQRVNFPSNKAATNMHSWTINELEEGDLFYFCIPYAKLTAAALQHTRRRAQAHAVRMNKLLAVLPRSAMARRSLLHDVTVNIMPAVVHALSQFIQWFHLYGVENVKLPLLIYFQDDEQQQRQSKAGGAKTLSEDRDSALLPQADEVALHAGNLIPIMQQIAFYLQRRAQRQQQQQQQQEEEHQQWDGKEQQRQAGGADMRSLWKRVSSASQGYSSAESDKMQQSRQMSCRTTELDAVGIVSPPFTQRKSSLLRDIDRQIECLEKAEFPTGADGKKHSASFLPFQDMTSSPHNTLSHRDGSLRDSADDIEVSSADDDDDDFDELKRL